MSDKIAPQRDSTELIDHVVAIVASFVAHNSVPVEELTQVLSTVHLALCDVGPAASPAEPVEIVREPAVSVRKSVRSDHLVCLEDGLRFKSLKRHLSASHNLTPNEYRAKWELPKNYPMVAADYAAIRSEQAKAIGLGLKEKRSAPTAKTAKASTVKMKTPVLSKKKAKA